MHSWRAPERWARVLAGLALLVAGSGMAASEVERAAIRHTPSGPVLDARVKIELTPPVADALTRGIAQPFVAELEIERERSWWFDQEVFDAKRRARLSYTLLSRTWLVETDGRSRAHASLDEALTALGAIDGWLLPDRFRSAQRYRARLRVRLDTEALPKPLIVGSFTSDRWELATPWFEWRFDGPTTDKPAP